MITAKSLYNQILSKSELTDSQVDLFIEKFIEPSMDIKNLSISIQYGHFLENIRKINASVYPDEFIEKLKSRGFAVRIVGSRSMHYVLISIPPQGE